MMNFPKEVWGSTSKYTGEPGEPAQILSNTPNYDFRRKKNSAQ